jgi:metal-responsive CopG/Arc/MetJ family transcriptional regulator
MAKINISLPDRLLEEVDAIAVELHGSRSGFVAEATARYVATLTEERTRAERQKRIDRALEQAAVLGEKFGSFDAVASVRDDRDRDGRVGGDM